MVGTLFLKEDKGLQTAASGAPNLQASLISANNFMGCLFFSIIQL